MPSSHAWSAAAILAAVVPQSFRISCRAAPSVRARSSAWRRRSACPAPRRRRRTGLRQRIGEMESRLREQPDDAAAAILLADALLRQARAATDGRAANRAGDVLGAVLKDNPGQYDALRLLGAVHLSRHRFKDALDLGRRARDQRPDDAWNYGVIGDALIELGEYDQAFDGVQTRWSRCGRAPTPTRGCPMRANCRATCRVR